MMPYYDINFMDFIDISLTLKIYKSILFQIIVALICFQKYLFGHNKSLHNSNILIKYIYCNITISLMISIITFLRMDFM